MNQDRIIRDTANRGSVVVREVGGNFPCALSAFVAVCGEDDGFLLESSPGRYTFLGRLTGLVVQDDAEDQRNSLPLDAAPLKFECPDLPPFIGGWVGYLGYDLVRGMERLPRPAISSDFPDAVLGRAETVVVLDHEYRRVSLVHAVCTPGCTDRDLRQRAQVAFAPLETALAGLTPRQVLPPAGPCAVIAVSMDDDAFKESVIRAKDYLASGDIMQVVLSRRLEVECRDDPLDVYGRLRQINPSPYLFYLRLGDITLAGSSPEVMVRLTGDEITVMPIAGTRPRGRNRAEDERLAAELNADPKERAEHLMLLDLARNDVGRVAAPGSVRLTSREQVKLYSHVMHLVSEVRGRKHPESTTGDVVRACFPAGTLSGAPKVRAMEIIDELEGRCRGPYGGAVGYFGFDGNVDTGITIRTIVSRGHRTFIQAGAGIVWDSDPACELTETNHKLAALACALGGLQ